MNIGSKIVYAATTAGRVLFLSALVAAFVTSKAQSPEVASVKAEAKETILLGLVGYNYTDRHISEYSVDSASGGHINLSSPTSGGSGITCCVKISKNQKNPIRVKVRWQVDGCTFIERNPRTGATAETRRFYYKETVVNVHADTGAKQNFIETHFYPNDQVRIHLTENGSDPKIFLSGSRPDKSHFPRCKNGETPR